MTQLQVSDEMLMAFVDGELDDAETSRIESLISADDALAARAERLLVSRELVREALAPVRTEVVPPHLIAAALGTTQDLAPPRVKRPPQWAMAACVALVAGALGYFAHAAISGVAPPARLMAQATSVAVLDAIQALPAGAEARLSLAGADVAAQVVGSFPVDAGYCRLFTLTSGPEQVRALSCGNEAGWSVPVAVLESSDGFQPASGAEAIDVYLDNAGAGGALDSAAEAEAIARGWRN